MGENGVCDEFGVIASSINPLISDKLEVIVLILLGIIIARKPECLMVARHGKLRFFLLDCKIVQVFLLRELITKTNPVVKHPEAD